MGWKRGALMLIAVLVLVAAIAYVNGRVRSRSGGLRTASQHLQVDPTEPPTDVPPTGPPQGYPMNTLVPVTTTPDPTKIAMSAAEIAQEYTEAMFLTLGYTSTESIGWMPARAEEAPELEVLCATDVYPADAELFGIGGFTEQSLLDGHVPDVGFVVKISPPYESEFYEMVLLDRWEGIIWMSKSGEAAPLLGRLPCD